ncbi:MAG: hypothetical protein JRI68_23935 [Deltaproteobacteria bacterium]|nr:hypothetical protein [Deltaproteobacteria bacterium]
MKKIALTMITLISAAALAGCTATQELEVTGEITSAQSVAGPIALEFFEIAQDDEEAERESVHKVELEGLGSFTETVEIAEDANIVIVALEDGDGDGACTDGELWAELEVTPNDDGTVDAVALELAAAPCGE